MFPTQCGTVLQGTGIARRIVHGVVALVIARRILVYMLMYDAEQAFPRVTHANLRAVHQAHDSPRGAEMTEWLLRKYAQLKLSDGSGHIGCVYTG